MSETPEATETEFELSNGAKVVLLAVGITIGAAATWTAKCIKRKREARYEWRPAADIHLVPNSEED